MNGRILSAALAAVALCAPPAAAQPAPPSNLPPLTAPASNFPAATPCGCPLAECKCGPVCPCPVPAVMPKEATVRVSQGNGSGTGAVVHAAAGRSLVVTNHHVVPAAAPVSVAHGGKTYPARVLGYAPDGDLALLEVLAPLPAAALGDDPAPGTAVTHWGLSSGKQRGTVRGYESMAVPSLGWSGSVAVGDYATAPGDSGAGLFDDSGRLVAVLWGGHPAARYSAPVSRVKNLLARFTGRGAAPAPAEPLYRDPAGELLTMEQIRAKYPGQPIHVAGSPVAGTGSHGAPSFGSPCANGNCAAPVTYRRR